MAARERGYVRTDASILALTGVGACRFREEGQYHSTLLL